MNFVILCIFVFIIINIQIVENSVLPGLNRNTRGSFITACYFRVDQDDVLPIEKINGTLCSHLLLGFASVSNGSIVPSEPGDKLKYEQAVQLRDTRFPKLKVMVSAGGGGNIDGFHEAVLSKKSRAKYGFYGLKKS